MVKYTIFPSIRVKIHSLAKRMLGFVVNGHPHMEGNAVREKRQVGNQRSAGAGVGGGKIPEKYNVSFWRRRTLLYVGAHSDIASEMRGGVALRAFVVVGACPNASKQCGIMLAYL